MFIGPVPEVAAFDEADWAMEVMFSFMVLMSETCVRPGAYSDPNPLPPTLFVLRCQNDWTLGMEYTSVPYHMTTLSSTWPDLEELPDATDMPPTAAIPGAFGFSLNRLSDFAFLVLGVIGASFELPFRCFEVSVSGELDDPK